MKNISFSAAAKYAGITRDQLRYWIKLLNIKPTKEGRTLFLPNGSEKLLEAMHKAVKSGLSLKASVREVLSIHALPKVMPGHKNMESNQILTNRISSLEQAVMLLVEQNKNLAITNKAQGKRLEEQNKFILTTLQAQNNHLKNIKLQLTPLRTTKQIKVWKPTEPTRPKYSTFQRIWYEITNPQKLRAN